MSGWIIPPPREPEKIPKEFKKEKEEKIQWLIDQGFLRSERLKKAMLKIRREDFIPVHYRDYAYLEVPLPLLGEMATISCPHSYPLFYEALWARRAWWYRWRSIRRQANCACDPK